MLRLIKAREVGGAAEAARAHIHQTKRSYLVVLGRRNSISGQSKPDTAIAPASAAVCKKPASASRGASVKASADTSAIE